MAAAGEIRRRFLRVPPVCWSILPPSIVQPLIIVRCRASTVGCQKKFSGNFDSISPATSNICVSMKLSTFVIQVGKESGELERELRTLERQSLSSKQSAGSIDEALWIEREGKWIAPL